MLQALSRTKGRLSIDYRQQNVEHHHNPYLGMELIAERKYVPRAKEVEPLVPVPNFRKLKQFEKDSNYRSAVTGAGAGAVAGVGKGAEKKTTTTPSSSSSGSNTMDLIQESKERIKEKREREKRLKEERAHLHNNTTTTVPSTAPISADPRDSLYRNRFSHIPPELT
jgi:hypothetical protein